MLFKKRKLISTFLIVLLVISVLLVESCAKNNSANTNKSGSSQESPTVVTIFTEFNTPQPPNSNNAAQKEIEKRTNTKLNIMWASANNFKQKENVILASGNIPDLMKI
ncbi:MAG TPA: ABC transporter substrate-binding protein, partial [Clostridiaceae bacterium]|nr:ABC transporter substrate-binding protein [Clostridiaceae bacterium]